MKRITLALLLVLIAFKARNQSFEFPATLQDYSASGCGRRFVLTYEGTVSADPKDPASAFCAPATKGLDDRFPDNHVHTVSGVTWRTYCTVYNLAACWNKQCYTPTDSARMATETDVRAFILLDTTQISHIWNVVAWQPVWADSLPRPLAIYMASYAWGSGSHKAVKALQRIAGVKPDGIMGSNTLNAVRCLNADFVLDRLHTQRMRALKRNRRSSYFSGWLPFCSRLHNAIVNGL